VKQQETTRRSFFGTVAAGLAATLGLGRRTDEPDPEQVAEQAAALRLPSLPPGWEIYEPEPLGRKWEIYDLESPG
jgi:hypothetical protein